MRTWTPIAPGTETAKPEGLFAGGRQPLETSGLRAGKNSRENV